MSLFSILSTSSRRSRKTAKLDLANRPALAVETLGKREMLSVNWSSYGYPATLPSPWSTGSSYTSSTASYGVGSYGSSFSSGLGSSSGSYGSSYGGFGSSYGGLGSSLGSAFGSYGSSYGGLGSSYGDYGSSSLGGLFSSTNSYGTSSYTSPSSSYSSYTPSLTITPITSRSTLTITPYSPTTTSQLTFTPLTQSVNRTYNSSFNGAGNIFGTNSGPRTSPPSQLQSPSRLGSIFTTRPSGPTSVPPLAPSYSTTSPSYTSPSYTSPSYTSPTYQGVGRPGSTTSVLDSSFFNWNSPTTGNSQPSRIRTGSVDYDFGSYNSGLSGSGSTSIGSSSSRYTPGSYYRQNGVDFYYEGTDSSGMPIISGAWIQPNGSRFRVTENSVTQTHGEGGYRYY